MGYVLSILMNALRTWLLTKLWETILGILAVMDCHYHSRSKCVAKRL